MTKWLPRKRRKAGEVLPWSHLLDLPFFDTVAASLTAVELTRLAMTNRHGREFPWPDVELDSRGDFQRLVVDQDVSGLLDSLADRLCALGESLRSRGVRWYAGAPGCEAVVPLIVRLLGHEDHNVKEEASAILWWLLQGEEVQVPWLVRRALKLGALPHLVAQLNDPKIMQQMPLFCLEAMVQAAPQVHDAELLTALFQLLRETQEAHEEEVILGILDSLVEKVPQALLGENEAERRLTVRKLVDIATGRIRRQGPDQQEEAQRLLEQLVAASAPIGQLISQAGFQAAE